MNDRLNSLLELHKNNPDDSFITYGIALEYISMQKYSDAEEYLNSLLQKDPDYVPAYMQLAQVKEKLDKINEACEVYKKGIEAAKNKTTCAPFGKWRSFWMSLSEKEILDIFSKTEALLKGHFRLTSGRHSSLYFQCAKVLQFPWYARQLCSIITEKFKDFEIDTVVAPAIGGLVVGQEVARQLNKRYIFAEREHGKLTLRRGFTLKPDEKVLVCEDVVTTGGSVFEVIDIIKSNKAKVVGIGFIVDRSNGTVDFGYPQVSAVKLNVKSYEPDECPLCKEGIEIVKPGSRKI